LYLLRAHRYRYKDIVTVTCTCHSLQAAEGKIGGENLGKPAEKRPVPATFGLVGRPWPRRTHYANATKQKSWKGVGEHRGGATKPEQTNKQIVLSAVTRGVCVTFSACLRCPNKKGDKKQLLLGMNI